LQRMTSSRTGTLVLGAITAVVAAALLLVYVSQVRKDASNQSATVSVLVANTYIPKNTGGDTIAAKKWYSIVATPKNLVEEGAITDAGSINGRVAAHDIYPNSQLTTADFADAPSGAVTYKLADNERAISIPLDSAAGLTPFLQAGDKVDIVAGYNVIPIGANGAPISGGAQARPVVKSIAQGIDVLEVPSSDGSGSGSGNNGNVVVRVTEQQAWDIAFAINNGTIFLLGAPPNEPSASAEKPSIITLETQLLGVPPIKVYRSFGGR
jgi:pilus assembly protein CpaB